MSDLYRRCPDPHEGAHRYPLCEWMAGVPITDAADLIAQDERVEDLMHQIITEASNGYLSGARRLGPMLWDAVVAALEGSSKADEDCTHERVLYDRDECALCGSVVAALERTDDE